MTKKTRFKEWCDFRNYLGLKRQILDKPRTAVIRKEGDLHRFLSGTYRYCGFLEETVFHAALGERDMLFFRRAIAALKQLYELGPEQDEAKVSSEFIQVLNQANANNETFLSYLFHYCTESDLIFEMIGRQPDPLTVLQGVGIKVEWLKPSLELRNSLQQSIAMSVALKSNALRCFKQYLQLKLSLGSEKMGLQTIFDATLAETDRYGATLLHYAAVGKDETLLDYILPRYEKNKTVHCQTTSGNTALHWAVLNNKAQALKKLMKAGLDADTPNAKGETPRQLALYYSDHATLEALLEGTKEWSEKTAVEKKVFFDSLEAEPSQREHIPRIQQLVGPIVDGFAIIDSDFTSFIINQKFKLDLNAFARKSKPMAVLKQLYDGESSAPLPVDDLIVLEKVLREAIARVMGGSDPDWIQDEYYLKIYRLHGFYAHFETDIVPCEDLPHKLKELKKLWYKYVVFQGKPPLVSVDDATGSVVAVPLSAAVRMDNEDAVRFCDLTAHPQYAQFEEAERALICSIAALNPLMPLYTQTLLNYAVNVNAAVAVRLIVEHCRHWGGKDTDDKPPLFTAILLGRWGLVDLFMEFSRTLEVDDRGYTQLHYVVRQNSPEGHRYLSLLLAKFPGALNQKSKEGFTPLHIATIFGNTEAARILVQTGANVEARTRNGDTPLSLAVGNVQRDGSHKTLSDFLVSQGASTTVVNQNGFSPHEREKYWKALLGFKNFIFDRKAELLYADFYLYTPHYEPIRPSPSRCMRIFHAIFDSEKFASEMLGDLKVKDYRYFSPANMNPFYAFLGQQELATDVMRGEKPVAETLEGAYAVLPETRKRILGTRAKLIRYIVENSVEYKLHQEREKYAPKPLQTEKAKRKAKKKGKNQAAPASEAATPSDSKNEAEERQSLTAPVGDRKRDEEERCLTAPATLAGGRQEAEQCPTVPATLADRKRGEEESVLVASSPKSPTPLWIVNKLQGGRGKTHIRLAAFYLRNLKGILSFESTFASEWGFFEDLLPKHLLLTAKQHCLVTIIENLKKEHQKDPALSILSRETVDKLTKLREYLVKANYLFYSDASDPTDYDLINQILPLFKSLFPIFARLERTFLPDEMRAIRQEVDQLFETPACQKFWQTLESHYKSKQEKAMSPEKHVPAILEWMQELAPFYLGCKGANRFSGLSLLSKSHELKSILHFSLSQGIIDLEKVLHSTPQFQGLMIREVLLRIRPIRNMTAHGEEVSEEQMKAILNYIEDCDWLRQAPASPPTVLNASFS